MKISTRNNEVQSNRHTVLFVDDDCDIIDVLKRGLEMHGLHVHSFTSSQEALLAFKPNIYDIAILDIRMPAMTGFQLFREINRIDTGVAVCFLSAFEIQLEEFKRVFPSMHGVKTVIKKPVSINKLFKEITPFLALSPRATRNPS